MLCWKEGEEWGGGGGGGRGEEETRRGGQLGQLEPVCFKRPFSG